MKATNPPGQRFISRQPVLVPAARSPPAKGAYELRPYSACSHYIFHKLAQANIVLSIR
ncbi:hypothetical protein THAOC_27412, partial [Thalassiosira oceanica]